MRHDATAPIVNDVIPDGERPTWRSFADMVEGGRYDGEIEETHASASTEPVCEPVKPKKRGDTEAGGVR